jgi:hypothetical protein
MLWFCLSIPHFRSSAIPQTQFIRAHPWRRVLQLRFNSALPQFRNSAIALSDYQLPDLKSIPCTPWHSVCRILANIAAP